VRLAICHVFAVALLAGLRARLGQVVAVGLFTLVHKLVTPGDLSHLNRALFNLNSIISLCLFTGVMRCFSFKGWLSGRIKIHAIENISKIELIECNLLLTRNSLYLV
jgi:hypothetical protein